MPPRQVELQPGTGSASAVTAAMTVPARSRVYGEHRWPFAAGAALGSIVWFTVLGYGARLLRPVFARPAA